MRTSDGLPVMRGPRIEGLCLLVALVPLLVLFACSRPRVSETRPAAVPTAVRVTYGGTTLWALHQRYAPDMEWSAWLRRLHRLNTGLRHDRWPASGTELVVPATDAARFE